MKKYILIILLLSLSAYLFSANELIQRPLNVICVQLENDGAGSTAPQSADVNFQFAFYTSTEVQYQSFAANTFASGWYDDSVAGCAYTRLDDNTGIITLNLANVAYDYMDLIEICPYGPSDPDHNTGDYLSVPVIILQFYTDGTTFGSRAMTELEIPVGTNVINYYYDDGWGWDNPLPVTLSSFSAVLTDGTPRLQWITQSEVNNAGWNVYRSETDGLDESLQINSELISGAGTSSQQTVYDFSDDYGVTEGTTYNYWLESISFSGSAENHGPVSLYIPTDEENQTPDVPIVYGLHQNYPNPFNPDTYISFALQEPGAVKLEIYNIKGQKVINLFEENEVQKDKNITIYWDGCDQNGQQVSSGVYFYRLETENDTYNRKMLLTK
ncbi:MAG: T9SS type A sorting domain-containing protein [Candidatus Cloacimonetes bacterium]|nr:T9SS type A sorting domain-containing protein [Candidatus Cloacimonadota bacterium]